MAVRGMSCNLEAESFQGDLKQDLQECLTWCTQWLLMNS